MGGFSIWHILLFAVILLLLFGGNRFSSMMGDVAKGLKSFKQGMSDDEDDARKRYEEKRRAESPRLPRDQDTIEVTPVREDPTSAPPSRDDTAR